jgi:hypothetical protein
VSSLDSAITNFGQEFEPPDQGLCVGNGLVVEMVNSAYSIYRKNGSRVVGPFNVNGPFDEGLREFTSDPRCHFDKATDRWFATIVFLSSDATESHVDIAVSETSDPNGLWRDYQIDTTDANAPASFDCPCFGDQPRLGIDSQNLYITTDEFSILGTEFNGDHIYAIAKSDLVNLVNRPHFVDFSNLRIGGTQATVIQPALTTGTPAAEYFLNSLDPNGTFDQRLGVWAMTHRERVATGGKPKLTSRVIASEAYAPPLPAEQHGSDSLIDAGDDRMQQVQAINGRVVGELGTSLTIPGDPVSRAGAAWFIVKPTVASQDAGLTAATITRQGYVGAARKELLYPALQFDSQGRGTMVVSLTGPDRFPSAAYTVLPVGSTTFGPISVAGSGTTFYDPFSVRWGDYSWAVLDPDGSGTWLATEYMPPRSRQTVDRSSNWGTRVFEVSP